ncbi:hypothetical protein BKA66DRAFT_570081 [Pyrenochaeta sp. MPI-SDFR-AT-0127]|nr:hypothetical protein BKA66DRAFT_570081 [Pyrenochaeta sp. MPI-SDFR-AT-0127]
MAQQTTPLPPAATRSDFLCEDLRCLSIHNMEDPSCPICLEAYSDEDCPVQIQNVSGCRHICGRFCLVQWLEISNTCPMCRAKLFEFGNQNISPIQRPLNWWARLFHLPVNLRLLSVPSPDRSPSLSATAVGDHEHLENFLIEQEEINTPLSPLQQGIDTRRRNAQHRRQVRESNRRRIANDIALDQQEETVNQVMHYLVQNMRQDIIELGEWVTQVEDTVDVIGALSARTAQIRMRHDVTNARLRDLRNQLNILRGLANHVNDEMAGSDEDVENWDGSTPRNSVVDLDEFRDLDIDDDSDGNR